MPRFIDIQLHVHIYIDKSNFFLLFGYFLVIRSNVEFLSEPNQSNQQFFLNCLTHVFHCVRFAIASVLCFRHFFCKKYPCVITLVSIQWSDARLSISLPPSFRPLNLNVKNSQRFSLILKPVLRNTF